jgi:hypothetical protein
MVIEEEKIQELKTLATQFRNALEAAHRAGDFVGDPCFAAPDFPRGCCGDVCYLLEHFLLDHGISTYHIIGEYYDENPENYRSHAWLATIDFCYTIDITGDQFKDDPLRLNYNEKVYVGEHDDFHHLFAVAERNVHVSCRLSDLRCLDERRLPSIYGAIMKYMDHDAP